MHENLKNRTGWTPDVENVQRTLNDVTDPNTAILIGEVACEKASALGATPEQFKPIAERFATTGYGGTSAPASVR
jgi:hypothetical protein